MIETNYFTAIFFDDKKKAYKFRNILNDSAKIDQFISFALTKKAVEINFYCTYTKKFSHKVFLKVKKIKVA
jgi:hypothetical protein